MSNSFFSKKLVANSKFTQWFQRFQHIHISMRIFYNKMKQWNYKIHFKFSFDAIIFKIDRARIEICDKTCLKLFAFCRKIKVFRSFQDFFAFLHRNVSMRVRSILDITVLNEMIILNKLYNFIVSLHYYRKCALKCWMLKLC